MEQIEAWHIGDDLYSTDSVQSEVYCWEDNWIAVEGICFNWSSLNQLTFDQFPALLAMCWVLFLSYSVLVSSYSWISWSQILLWCFICMCGIRQEIAVLQLYQAFLEERACKFSCWDSVWLDNRQFQLGLHGGPYVELQCSYSTVDIQCLLGTCIMSYITKHSRLKPPPFHPSLKEGRAVPKLNRWEMQEIKHRGNESGQIVCNVICYSSNKVRKVGQYQTKHPVWKGPRFKSSFHYEAHSLFLLPIALGQPSQPHCEGKMSKRKGEREPFYFILSTLDGNGNKTAIKSRLATVGDNGL